MPQTSPPPAPPVKSPDPDLEPGGDGNEDPGSEADTLAPSPNEPVPVTVPSKG